MKLVRLKPRLLAIFIIIIILALMFCFVLFLLFFFGGGGVGQRKHFLDKEDLIGQ